MVPEWLTRWALGIDVDLVYNDMRLAREATAAAAKGVAEAAEDMPPPMLAGQKRSACDADDDEGELLDALLDTGALTIAEDCMLVPAGNNVVAHDNPEDGGGGGAR